jgi:hypothetical protein
VERKTMSEQNTFGSVYKPTIWNRLGFGRAHAYFEDDEIPGYAESALITETHVHLDFLDRLRVLITGHVHVYVRTKTDVPIGKAFSISSARVAPPTIQGSGK